MPPFFVVTRPKHLCFLLIFSITLLIFSSRSLSESTLQDLSPFLYQPISVSSAPSVPSHVLLVSAFFPLAKSKHSPDDYAIWLSRFLKPVNSHIYFFTTPEMADSVRKLRGDRPMTLNTSFSSPFAIPPLAGLEPAYQRMHHWDTEGDIHSPELYAVWSSKTFLLDEGMKNMLAEGHHYDYAFWNDAGSFRDDQQYGFWPDGRRISEIWNEAVKITHTPGQDLIFMPIWDGPKPQERNWNESLGPLEVGAWSEGSFFGGSQKAIAWFRQVFYAYHDYYIFKLGVFAGKDQTIFNTILLLFPKRFITVWQYDQDAPALNRDAYPLGKCGGTWWYYQFFVASPEDRELMRSIWDPPTQNGRGILRFANNETTCRLTRLLTMEEVILRRFGRSWRPPKTTINIYESQRS